jgi:retron-type reverse transcriptase
MQFDLEALIEPTIVLHDLSNPFTKEEIDEVIKQMPADKAPGPDGFNGQFLKSCWHIIKEDVYQLCFEFYDGQLDMESINMGYITLIPKIGSPECVNDFRPITLLNCCLKIITKLLANRLQTVVLKIVHKNQYGFLKGRSIQDCLAWAFEFIHQCEASKQEIILLKLDFAKAFDTIDHIAMLKIMRQMGFDDKWLKWIENIFGSGMSAVLLNGVPGRKFHCKRGVRQGDPLSPLIFVLAADLLQSAINKAVRDHIIHAPFSPDYGMDFPVIQYADDTIIILPAKLDEIMAMKEILNNYASSTGLHINYHKSLMIPINTSDCTANLLAHSLGCIIGKMPFTYLGLPLGTTKPTVQDMMPLVDRIERSLTANYMMMAYSGRVRVINSLLTSIAMFAMCSIKITPKILEHVEKIRRLCLWNKKDENGEEK